MSLKKPKRSEDGEGSDEESKRAKRQRQRALARRQKALAESERKRRKEAKKGGAEQGSDEPEKPAAKKGPGAKQPTSKKAPPSKKATAEKRPDSKKPETKRRPALVGASKAGATKAGAGVSKVSGGIVAIVVEALKLGREMLVIPLQVWLGIAEVVGRAVLTVWLRVVLPTLRFTLRALRGLLHFAERHVTPARALGVVALVAIAALIASQWRDYSAISVGVDAYAGDVGSVAPPPEVSSAPAHDAHGWVMVILGAVGVVALVGAFAKRPRLGIWLAAVGIAVLAISLAVDAPKGLDEGDAAVAYESASATLLSGFWLQIAAATVLIGCGLMLPRALRLARSPVTTTAEAGPSLLDRLVARVRTTLERRRSRSPKKRTRRLPSKLRRPTSKAKVQGART